MIADDEADKNLKALKGKPFEINRELPKPPLRIKQSGYGCPALYDADGRMLCCGRQSMCEEMKAEWEACLKKYKKRIPKRVMPPGWVKLK